MKTLDEFLCVKSVTSTSRLRQKKATYTYILHARLNFCVYTPAGDRAFGKAMVRMPHNPRNSSQKSRQSLLVSFAYFPVRYLPRAVFIS